MKTIDQLRGQEIERSGSRMHESPVGIATAGGRKPKSVAVMVSLALALVLCSCSSKDDRHRKTPEEKTPSPLQSLLQYPKANIHVEFLQPSPCKWTIPVARQHTSKDNQILAHRGEANGIATPERASSTLHWEFIGRSHWTHGDVYLFKFDDPVNPGASWVKSVVCNGSPVEVMDSTDIWIEINESDQVEQRVEGDEVRR